MSEASVGLLGTGHIAAALVAGWRAGPGGPDEILLSPRNAATAAALVNRHAGVSIAADNQDVLDRAQTILLCVRPQVAAAILSPLTFRPGQRILSLIATFNNATLAPLVAPADDIVRAVPMPFVAARRGPLAAYPARPWASRLLATLGDVIEAESETAFDRFCAVTATMSAYFRALAAMSDWLKAGGITPALAERYVASQFQALGLELSTDVGTDYAALVDAFATKAGLNEQFRDDLDTGGVFDRLTQALDRVLARIEGRPVAHSSPP